MRTLALLTLIFIVIPTMGEGAPADWVYGVYLDLGYLASDNDPENRTWRTKSTTFKLDRLEANMATVYVRKETSMASRWGFEIGLQTGVDTDGLVTSGPPASLEPVSDADTWTSFAPSNVSYLFAAGKGLSVTGGLLAGISPTSRTTRCPTRTTRGVTSPITFRTLRGGCRCPTRSTTGSRPTSW